MAAAPTVGRLLRRAFGLLLALIGVAGLSGALATASQQSAMRELTARIHPARLLSLTVLDAMHDARLALRGYLLSGDGALVAEVRRAREATPPALTRLRQVAPGHRASVDALADRARRWWSHADQQLARGPRSPAAAAALPAGEALMDDVLAVNATLVGELERRAERLESQTARLTRVRLGALAALVATAALLAWVTWRRVSRRITGPLDELAGVLDRLGGGELDARMSSHPELAELARVAATANTMAEELAAARRQQEKLVADERRLVGRMRELERAKNDFLTTASHELRTPLSSLAGYVEALREGDLGPLADAQLRALGVVERSTARLVSLVDDLLVLTQVEVGGLPHELSPVDVGGLVDEVAGGLAERARAAGVALEPAAGPPVRVTADPQQLRRVLGHLLGNALKFTPRGGSVRTTVGRTDDAATIEVTDTGIGIPYADQQHLFTTFYRASNAVDQAIQGSGLGLVIVRTIVDRHGGGVHLRSTPGQGTTVTLSLPLRTEST